MFFSHFFLRYQHIFACGFTGFELQFFLFLISFVVSKTCMFLWFKQIQTISSFSITKHGFLEDLKSWINNSIKVEWVVFFVFSVVWTSEVSRSLSSRRFKNAYGVGFGLPCRRCLVVGMHGRMMDFQPYYGGGKDLSKRKGAPGHKNHKKTRLSWWCFTWECTQ